MGRRKNHVNEDEKEKATKMGKTEWITMNKVREKTKRVQKWKTKKGGENRARRKIWRRKKNRDKTQEEKIKDREDKENETPKKQRFLETSEMNYIIGTNSKYRLSLLPAAVTDYLFPTKPLLFS